MDNVNSEHSINRYNKVKGYVDPNMQINLNIIEC